MTTADLIQFILAALWLGWNALVYFWFVIAILLALVFARHYRQEWDGTNARRKNTTRPR
jgi:hypothetical protein